MTKGRVLITGAAKGIGLAIADRLNTDGYPLDLIVKTQKSAEELASSALGMDSNNRVYVVDLTDKSAIARFVDGFKNPIWGLVNNAGICKTHPLRDAGLAPFDDLLATNLAGPYALTKGLLNRITRPGRIVNISSQLGHEGRADYGAYCASKFGLIGLTKCWAKELGREGITVNAVCPGWVSTEMSMRDIARLADEMDVTTDELYQEICSPLELKRFNTPQEVAALVAFLISTDSSGISGRDWLMQTIWNNL